MGLFNAIIKDEAFYQLAKEGGALSIDRDQKTVQIDGHDEVFKYHSSWVEDALLDAGGILPLYHIHGSSVFTHLTSAKSTDGAGSIQSKMRVIDNFDKKNQPHAELAW